MDSHTLNQTKPRKTSVVFVHVLAIRARRNVNISSAKMPDELLITLMNDTGTILQFGPRFTNPDRERILRILGDIDCPKVGYDILWSAFDIHRILPQLKLMRPLLHVPWPKPEFIETSSTMKRPLVYQRHILDVNTREMAKQLVQNAMRDRSSAIPLPDIYAKFGLKMVDRYTLNLHLWRYKWLEIQDQEVEVRGYTLECAPDQETQGGSLYNQLISTHPLSGAKTPRAPRIVQDASSDENETWQSRMRRDHQVGDNKSRPMSFFILLQTQWRSHVRSGTKLRIVTKQREYKAIINDIDDTRVRFAIFGDLTSTQGRCMFVCVCVCAMMCVL